MPITKIAVHDYRLAGQLRPETGVTNLRVEQGETLPNVAVRIIQATQQAGGSVRSLEIYAHGFYAHPGDPPGEGQTILLSRDRLHMGNAFLFGSFLRGKVTDSITLSVCNAAARPNGAATCTLIARGAQVRVLASDALQNYDASDLGGFMDVGAWEGRLYEFVPDGTSRQTFTGTNPVVP